MILQNGPNDIPVYALVLMTNKLRRPTAFFNRIAKLSLMIFALASRTNESAIVGAVPSGV